MEGEVIEWLIHSDEPWTRYRTRLDLLEMEHQDSVVQRDKEALLSHPLVKGLFDAVSSWPGYPLKRHNDAKHPLYALSTLADFGVSAENRGLAEGIGKVLKRQSDEGPFQALLHLYKKGLGDWKENIGPGWRVMRQPCCIRCLLVALVTTLRFNKHSLLSSRGQMKMAGDVKLLPS